MKAFKAALLGALLLGLTGLLFHARILRAARGFLVVAGTPVRADAVVVFCGGAGERIRYGLRLLREGFAKRILFCGTEAEARLVRSFLEEEGRTETAEVEIRSGLPTTYDSLKYVEEWAPRRGGCLLLVVSSPIHLRRIRILSRRVFGKGPPRVVLCPAPEEMGQREWWRNASARHAVLLEWKKLLWSWLRYWR